MHHVAQKFRRTNDPRRLSIVRDVPSTSLMATRCDAARGHGVAQIGRTDRASFGPYRVGRFAFDPKRSRLRLRRFATFADNPVASSRIAEAKLRVITDAAERLRNG